VTLNGYHITIYECMKSKLDNSILSNGHHVLHQLLPPERVTWYNTWQYAPTHLTLSSEDSNLIRKNFLRVIQGYLLRVHTCDITFFPIAQCIYHRIAR